MNSAIDNILTGEAIEQLADIYIGEQEDFDWNPVIKAQPQKCMRLQNIPTQNWNNPPVIFCHSTRVSVFATKLESLQNPATIVFGNSDKNMSYELYKPYLHNDKVIHIFCQNLLFSHQKATLLPIGIANNQWAHGNKNLLVSTPINKTKHILASFSTHTNPGARNLCESAIRSKSISNHHFSSQIAYVRALAEHKYVVCPEGNGVDTHRFWEALLMHAVPIVLKSPFIDNVKSLNIPIITLNSWSEFNPDSMPPYEEFVFNSTPFSLETYKNLIKGLNTLNQNTVT